MGMTGWQQFCRVELPLALPLVVSGLRLALVQVWATATIAALVAGPGLGTLITEGFYRTDYAKGIAAAIVVAVVAFVLELIGAAAERAADPARRAVTRKGVRDAHHRWGMMATSCPGTNGGTGHARRPARDTEGESR